MLNPEIIQSLERKTEKKFFQFETLAWVWVALLILTVTVTLALTIHVLKAPLTGASHDVIAASALNAFKWIAFFLGPIILVLIGLGFLTMDFLQEFIPSSWKNEIITSGAVRKTAWFIGYDLIAIAIVYLWDFSKVPQFYGLLLIILVVLAYQSGGFPSAVIREKGKK